MSGIFKPTSVVLKDMVRQHEIWLKPKPSDVVGQMSRLVKTKGEQLNLSGADLTMADLSHRDLRKAVLPRTSLRQSVLNHINLRGANLEGADLRGADLRYAKLSGANLSRANLEGADLSFADLLGAKLVGTDLNGANLEQCDLQEAELVRANLAGAHLEYVNLYLADLRSAHLTGANLVGALCSGSRMERAEFVSAVMDGATLYAAILDEANLTHVSLKKASLAGASFRKVNLTGADLEGAHTRNWTQRRTNFLRAELQGANLKRGDFKACVNLTQMQINETSVSERTALPEGLVLPAANTFNYEPSFCAFYVFNLDRLPTNYAEHTFHRISRCIHRLQGKYGFNEGELDGIRLNDLFKRADEIAAAIKSPGSAPETMKLGIEFPAYLISMWSNDPANSNLLHEVLDHAQTQGYVGYFTLADVKDYEEYEVLTTEQLDLPVTLILDREEDSGEQLTKTSSDLVIRAQELLPGNGQYLSDETLVFPAINIDSNHNIDTKTKPAIVK